MAEILYVDWDGLIYYDGKVKDYIEDKIKECLKFRGNVSYEELLQTSPSVDTVNTAFRLSEEFVTNEWFNKPGFAYPEGTIVYVAQFEDGTYKFDILVEPNGSNSGTDLTNYYNKQEVDNIVSELPTKEFVEKTVIDAIDSVEIDVSGLVAREELELLETKEDAEAKLTAANKYTDDQISAIMGEGVEEAYNSFKELQELMKADDGVTQTLLNDVSELKIETKALEMSKANSQHVHSVNDIAGLPNYSDLATREELEAVQQTAGSNSVKLFAIESDLVDINQKLDDIETPDLSGYATEEWVNTQGFLKEHQDLSDYATKDELFSKDYNELINTPEIPSVEGLASETWVNSQGFLTEHQSLEEYAKLTDIPEVSGFTTLDEVANQGYLLAADIENKADKSELENVAHLDDLTSKLDVSVFEQEKNALATKEELNAVENAIPTNISQLNNDATFATEQFVIDKIAEAELSGKDVDLTGYAKESYVDEKIAEIKIPEVPTNVSAFENDANYITLNDVPETDLTNYYTKSEVENLIPDVSNLVSRETLNTELDKKANDILFTDNYVVTTPFGGFVSNESVQNMTISQIITKLLGLTLYVPPTPDIELPDSSPEIAVEIVTNKAPVSVLDENGNLVEVTNPDDFYRELGTEEAKLDNQVESFFYQIVDDNGEVVESGYQVSTIYQENDYLTVLIPNTITNFHVEEYSALAGDWSQPTWELVENPNYAVDGFTAYTVPEQYGVLSGIAIRIVINN